MHWYMHAKIWQYNTLMKIPECYDLGKIAKRHKLITNKSAVAEKTTKN